MHPSRTQYAIDSAAQLYLGFFGRAPDTAGLLYWSGEIDRGLSPIEVAMGFATSAEFTDIYGALSPRGKIELAYRNILEREADPDGAQYWTNKLITGTPIGEVIWSLVNAAFSQQGTVDGLLTQGKIAESTAISAPVLFDRPISEWSIKTGYGQIDVAAAMEAILGRTIVEGMRIETSIEQWSTPVLRFEDVWAAGFTGKGVVIASIDSGIDLNNAAITQNLSQHSWNFVDNNANTQDDHGHGTAIASQMIARPIGDELVPSLIGGAFDAELMVLKVIDSSGNGTLANLIAAIDHAVEHGADVINVSLGGGGMDVALLDALLNAADNGVIITLAAGNSGEGMPQFPARFAELASNTIAVGSTAESADGSISLLTSTNAAGSSTPYNYILAPGATILSYGLQDDILSWSGTSFATPFVTAAIANLLSANTGLTANQIVDALVNTSVQLVANKVAETELAFEIA